MVRVCLKCEYRMPESDEPYGPCPNRLGAEACGANEWAVVDAPLKPYRISQTDRRFLKSLRITSED